MSRTSARWLRRAQGSFVTQPPQWPRPTRRQFLCSLLLTGLGLAPGLTPSRRNSSFVTTQHTGFVLQGQPFAVAGTNVHYLGWGSRAEVDDVLTRAHAMGLNVVRSFIGCQIGCLDGPSPPTVWDRSSQADSSNLGVHSVYVAYWDSTRGTWAWNDSTVDGLGRWDYVIARAGQLGLRLHLILLDYWPYVGGAQQVAAWLLPGYDPKNDPRASRYFFEDTMTKAFYKRWSTHVITRVNTLTGVRYADDPVIFAWDLMNEPQIDNTVTGPGGVPLAQAWLTEMAGHVRSVDANHLITCGMEGFYDRTGVIEPEAVLAIPNIDFGCWHLYPDLYAIALRQVPALIERHGSSAIATGKPVLLQEFGYGDSHPDQPDAYQSWLGTLSASANRGGWLFWRLVGKVRLGPTRDFPAAEDDAPEGYPPDTSGGYDIIADRSSATASVWRSAQMLRAAADAARHRGRQGSAINATPGQR
jgi:mannan endo-1,4-beta-mannosidase